MVLMKLFAGQQQRHRHRKQTYRHSGVGAGGGAGRKVGKRGWDIWRE